MMQGETPKNNSRVWEIDAMRGLLLLCLLAWHLYFTVEAFCIDGYYQIDSYKWVNTTDPLHFWFDWGEDGVIYRAFLNQSWINFFMRSGVDTFFILSGISCAFSRNNLKRALKVLAAGVFIMAFTFILWQLTGDPTRFIRFGPLMCYAACQLIYIYLLEKRSNEALFCVATPVLAAGYYLRYHGVPAMSLPIFYIFGVPQAGDMSSDFWPIFPMLGWFLLGVVIGRKYYSEKKTLLPYKTADRLTRPLQFLGRHSGVIYIGHILLYTALFCGIGYLFGLL